MQEEFLKNVADELGNIGGTLTEIKQAQLNCATTDDLNALGQHVADLVNNQLLAVKDAGLESAAAVKKSVAESMDTVADTAVSTMESIKTDVENQMSAVRQTLSKQTATLASLAENVSEKLEAFTTSPPEQRVCHTVERSAWQWYFVLATSFVSVVLCAVFFLWQEGRIKQCRESDIKYHMILMHGGIDKEGLDSIESWFRDPRNVADWEKRVREHEERVAETARAIQNRDRLNQRIQELNSETNPTKSGNGSSKSNHKKQ